KFEDGTLMVLGPRDVVDLRFKKMNGDTGALWPTEAADAFEGGEGWGEREPVTNRVHFERNAAGQLTGITWQHISNGKTSESKAVRLPLREDMVTFRSGDLTLRGKLILPEGKGPFPVMVTVHGSEDYSGVDHYSDPYMHAA